MKFNFKPSIFKLIFFFLLFFSITNSLFAQDPGGDPDSQAVPLDGGVLGLAAVGISYGIKSYRDKKKAIKK